MAPNDECRNLVELFQRAVTDYADRPLLGTRGPDGTWTYASYRELGERVDAFRAGLARLGVGRGDRVAVISDNRPEWAVGAYATYGLGACYVPMYQKQNASDWRYILRDSGAKVALVANSKIAARVVPLIGELESLEHVVDFEVDGATGAVSYGELLTVGRASPVEAVQPEPDDLAGFIYTSGTTGEPKGVMLSHRNIVSNVETVRSLFPIRDDDRSLSFLPWAHSFGQTCELHMGISLGLSSAICDDVTQLVAYLGEVRPTMLVSVPRIFNRVYDGLNKKVAAGSPVKRFLFRAAMTAARQRRELAAQGRTSAWVDMKHRLLDRLVFAKVRDLLGGRLRFAFSGGAAISREVAEFISDIGVLVFEGYGLSETSPIATANTPAARRLGSVGKPIPHVEIFIDTAALGGAADREGEVLIKGPNVMMGYHGLDEETEAVMREDGAFRSGDIGWIDDDGFLFITGRIKEQYKLENGKYVVPAPLEEQLKLSGYVNQILVYGDNRPHNVALIVPDRKALEGWAEAQGLGSIPFAGLLDHPKVRGLYRSELERCAKDAFKGYERVRDFRLIAEEFTTENDMLTPTLKLKRRNVIQAYSERIESLYS